MTQLHSFVIFFLRHSLSAVHVTVKPYQKARCTIFSKPKGSHANKCKTTARHRSPPHDHFLFFLFLKDETFVLWVEKPRICFFWATFCTSSSLHFFFFCIVLRLNFLHITFMAIHIFFRVCTHSKQYNIVKNKISEK